MSGPVGDNPYRASGVVAAAVAGRTGTVNWDTTIYVTGDSPVTGENGKGYFLNTTCGAITVTLPSGPSAGDIVSIKDYADTFDTNSLTLCRNGSKISGGCVNALVNTEGSSITMIYADATRGWLNIQTDTTVEASAFITASGGTPSTCGDFKIHTFTGDGCFAVTAGTSAPNNEVSYLVIAGGGGAGIQQAGGGGAGGFREDKVSSDPYTASPLEGAGAITVSTQTYPIAVGAGGAGGTPGAPAQAPGSVSTFSTITSAGGGNGAPVGPYPGGAPGGSGGGAGEGQGTPGSTGNQPPTSPAQGTPGGNGNTGSGSGGGGGGAVGAGGNASHPGGNGGPGGAGTTTSISGSSVARGGGGGGGGYPSVNGPGGSAGPGGGGAAGNGTSPGAGTGGTAGTVNTGGGGGSGAGDPGGVSGGAGGSGTVIIRYKYQ